MHVQSVDLADEDAFVTPALEDVLEHLDDGTVQAGKTARGGDELGALDVHRASQVEFNPAEQVWEVRLTSNPGAVAFSHSSRAICLHWEREALQ